jgi:hypothetical protein
MTAMQLRRTDGGPRRETCLTSSCIDRDVGDLCGEGTWSLRRAPERKRRILGSRMDSDAGWQPKVRSAAQKNAHRVGLNLTEYRRSSVRTAGLVYQAAGRRSR